jgi:hypothetical protein
MPFVSTSKFFPTAEEIRAAYDAIKLDEATLGPSTSELATLILCDPILRAVTDRMAGARPMLEGRLAQVLAIAIATGLNYGLRIGEQRAAAAIAPDTSETVAEKALFGRRFETPGRIKP